MNRYVVALLPSIVLALAILTPTVVNAETPQSDNDNMWAVIISGFTEFQADTQYLYDVLKENYHFTEILYLHPNAITNTTFECLNKSIVRWAIRDWLGERSNSDDLIFLFIHTHGGGMKDYNATHYLREGGRYEFDGDEGNEVAETNIGYVWSDGYIFWGYDFNGNGVLEDDVYGGIDECILIQTKHNYSDVWNPIDWELYWDDEVAEDLDTLSYGKLVFLLQSCKTVNQTESCFSGGFIDDLSAPNRTIITASNETNYSWGYALPDAECGYAVSGYFSRLFINALDLNNSSSTADTDGNGLVSVGEAWQYAWDNDEARSPGVWYGGVIVHETPWIDDDGDGIPNHSDGVFASDTFFVSDMLKLCDLNDDHIVNALDYGEFGSAWDSEEGDDNWNAKCDFNGNGLVNGLDYGTFAAYWERTY